MAKYRKKPVVVEAFKWTGGPDQTEDPEWIVQAIERGAVLIHGHGDAPLGQTGLHLHIQTLVGELTANVGDYIIQGIKGELDPCKPDIFEQTYELVKE